MKPLVMRSIALLPLLAACDAPSNEERLGASDQRFTSQGAVLLDFELDGRLTADVVLGEEARPLIEAQLMYTVGQLNADRSVGRFERLVVSNIEIQSMRPGQAELTYHARLPVAWGGAGVPSSYALTLPAEVGEADQERFAMRYGEKCADGSAGEVNPGSMFLFFRPRQAGCAFVPSDVVTTTASVKVSTENTNGKYPEYQHIWEDNAFQVVAMFTRSQHDPTIQDEGGVAYDEFVRLANQYLTSVQPSDGARTITTTAGTSPTTRLQATLPNGRSVTIDVMLVGYRLEEDGPTFDRWYDAVTPRADLIVYNGHAGLGDNVRTLMQKGAFVPRQYAILALNGCDTLAYVDRTLADRRALLNPDDPLGTKYMDIVSNVMGGYFSTTPATSMTFVEALAGPGGASSQPETYQEIFSSIDPQQLVVVAGEEDNEFQTNPQLLPPVIVGVPAVPMSAELAVPHETEDGAGCDVVGRRRRDDVATAPVLVGILAVLLRRFRPRRRGPEASARP